VQMASCWSGRKCLLPADLVNPSARSAALNVA
jgi:hypothetical protein